MISVQECIVAGGFEHSGHFQLCIEMPHNMAGAINNMADMQLLCSTYIALCQLEAERSAGYRDAALVRGTGTRSWCGR